MKKVMSLMLAFLMAAFVFAIPANAKTLSSKEYKGKTYFDVTAKSDLNEAVAQTIAKRGTQINVWFRFNERNWDDSYACDVRNFTGYGTKAVFNSYAEYAVSTVCITELCNTEENGVREWYGYVEIDYSDSDSELRKADAKIDAKLASLSSLSQKDKMLAIADYICSSTSYGAQKLPDGGYDSINGVYDVLHGIQTNTVCTSYALTFQRFMERAGIKSVIVSNVGHAWNLVELDGVWYGVDCTEDNGNQIDRPHFLMGSTYMKLYDTSQLNPIRIFGKNHTISETNYGAGSSAKPPVSGNKPATPTTPVTPATPTAPSAAPGVTDISNITDSTVTAVPETTLPSADSQSVVLTDEASGVKLGAAEGVLPQGAALKAEAISEGEVFLRVQEALQDVSEKFYVYDITLHSGEAAVQPNGKVLVTLPIPADYNKDNLAVYYVADDGAKTELSCTVDGDSVTFETDHFSTYVLAEKTAEAPASHLGLILGIVGAILVIAGAGVAVYFVKFRKKNEA